MAQMKENMAYGGKDNADLSDELLNDSIAMPRPHKHIDSSQEQQQRTFSNYVTQELTKGLTHDISADGLALQRDSSEHLISNS